MCLTQTDLYLAPLFVGASIHSPRRCLMNCRAPRYRSSIRTFRCWCDSCWRSPPIASSTAWCESARKIWSSSSFRCVCAHAFFVLKHACAIRSLLHVFMVKFALFSRCKQTFKLANLCSLCCFLLPPYTPQPRTRAQVKPKKVAAHNLVADILKCAFTMIVEPARASGDDDDDADEEQGEDPQVHIFSLYHTYFKFSR